MPLTKKQLEGVQNTLRIGEEDAEFARAPLEYELTPKGERLLEKIQSAPEETRINVVSQRHLAILTAIKERDPSDIKRRATVGMNLPFVFIILKPSFTSLHFGEHVVTCLIHGLGKVSYAFSKVITTSASNFFLLLSGLRSLLLGHYILLSFSSISLVILVVSFGGPIQVYKAGLKDSFY